MRSLLIMTCCAMLASCAQFPEVDDVISKNADGAEYPDVIPLQDIADPSDGYLDENSGENLEGRINGLKRRADELRNKSIE